MSTITGSSGDDSLSGTSDGDDITGLEGNDTIEGGRGADTISGGDGDDSVKGDRGDDIIIEDQGANSGNDTLHGGDGNDSVHGAEGNDQIYGDAGQDTLHGGDGDDSIEGGNDDDSVSGDDGQDSISGGSGSDTIDGGNGDDSVSGGAGDDALRGGDGTDSLYGGSGSDYFDGGAGDDTYFTSETSGQGTSDPNESSNDVVRFEAGSGHDTAFDFDGEADYIYIGAIADEGVIATQTDSDTWVLTFAGNANDSLTINFAQGTAPDSEGDLRNQYLSDAEYDPPENGTAARFEPACFTPHNRILTPNGYRRIGSLRAGDLVITSDAGPQEVLEVLESCHTPKVLRDHVGNRAIVIEAGAFGPDLPQNRMHVSRQHAFVTGNGTALVRAAHLAETLDLAHIQHNRPNKLRYIHILLERHELLKVEGVWTESFFFNANNTDLVVSLDADIGTLARLGHPARCRPLLSRSDLRKDPSLAHGIGTLPVQSAPKILEDVPTA